MTLTTTAVITVHVLTLGYPACKFSGRQPLYWPAGHIWIRQSLLDAARRTIADPRSDLCRVAQFEICPRCERAIADPEQVTADVPVVVMAHRCCMRCGYPLSPWWPAIFCSQSCALDGGAP